MVRETVMIYRIAMTMLVAVAVFAGCSSNTQETPSQTQPAKRVAVQTEPIREMDFPIKHRFGGNLRGNRQTTIPARVATTVTEIPVRIGQSVTKGDTLVMLDPGGVQSQYRQAEALFRNAEKQVIKMRALFDAGAISEMQLDGAETGYDVAKANFNSARQSIEIQAPFDGVVTDIHVRLGDEVAPGMPIVEVADIGSLRLLLDVPTSQVGRLKTGLPVVVASPVESGVVMKGSIYSIADAADQATRSFEVECRFPTPPQGFSPGMYVMAEIETETLELALVVPSEALLYRSGKVMLYVVENDTVGLVNIAELASENGFSAVAGIIQPGQRVVVVGHKNLTPGALVREAGQ